MTAKEIRAYRNAAKRCTVTEARGRHFQDLLAGNIGLREIEEDVRKESSKFKGGSQFDKWRSREIVKLFMQEKLRDNKLFGVKLRKMRFDLRKSIEAAYGMNSRKVKNLVKSVRNHSFGLRNDLRKKYDRKYNFLSGKYGMQKCEALGMTE